MEGEPAGRSGIQSQRRSLYRFKFAIKSLRALNEYQMLIIEHLMSQQSEQRDSGVKNLWLNYP